MSLDCLTFSRNNVLPTSLGRSRAVGKGRRKPSPPCPGGKTEASAAAAGGDDLREA